MHQGPKGQTSIYVCPFFITCPQTYCDRNLLNTLQSFKWCFELNAEMESFFVVIPQVLLISSI